MTTSAGTRPSAVIVGAGLAGLTAAYRLHEAGWEVRVLESEPVIGGRVQTVERDGYLLDTAASAIGDSYAAYFALAEELGIRDEVVPASPYFGLWRDGRVHLLRLDRMIRSGIRTSVLSPVAKLRALRLGFDVAAAKARGYLDYSDMRKAAPLDTESAYDYARRCLGSELGDFLCEPVVRMMLIANAADVSRVELFSGLANILGSRIYALRGGQGRLPRLLADRVGGVDVNARVERVNDRGTDVEVMFRANGSGTSTTIRADACVLTCPLPVAAEICPDRASVLGPLNASIGYTQCLTVSVATGRVPDTPAMLVGMPAREDDAVALMFLGHNKCADRAPAGHGLIECDWETRASAAWFDKDDAAIEERTLQTVLRVFPELRGHVEFTHVSRWRRALPHTRIGAYKKIGEFNAALDPASRIQFAADYMSAAGQHTAIEFGTRAARALQNAHG